jgi:hypothetical protein
MAYFWVQTTMQTQSGDYVRFQVDAAPASVDEMTKLFVSDRLVLCDKVFTMPDGAGGKVVTSRERIALGRDYVGMLQLSDPQPYETER